MAKNGQNGSKMVISETVSFGIRVQVVTVAPVITSLTEKIIIQYLPENSFYPNIPVPLYFVRRQLECKRFQALKILRTQTKKTYRGQFLTTEYSHKQLQIKIKYFTQTYIFPTNLLTCVTIDLEIKCLRQGFEHKIPKLSYVSHCKISQENLRIKLYDQSY